MCPFHECLEEEALQSVFLLLQHIVTNLPPHPSQEQQRQIESQTRGSRMSMHFHTLQMVWQPQFQKTLLQLQRVNLEGSSSSLETEKRGMLVYRFSHYLLKDSLREDIIYGRNVVFNYTRSFKNIFQNKGCSPNK